MLRHCGAPLSIEGRAAFDIHPDEKRVLVRRLVNDARRLQVPGA
jgi:hypothetical protein